MRIRLRLTIYFLLIASSLLLVAFISIYWVSESERRHGFYNNLTYKAQSRAKLFANKFSQGDLKKIDQSRKELYDDQVLTIYDMDLNELYDNNTRIEFESLVPDMKIKLRELTASNRRIILEQDQMEIVGIRFTNGELSCYVVAGGVDTYGNNRIRNLRNNLILIFIAIISVMSIGGWIFAGQTLKPISKMIDQVGFITERDLTTRLDTGNGTDELAQLAITFNKMMDRIEYAFQLQKGFISNASHEIANPLTAITSQIEVALLKDRNTDDYKKLLLSIREDIERLNELTKQLLMLGKGEYDSARRQFQTFQVKELLQELISDYKLKFPKANIHLQLNEHRVKNFEFHGNYDLMYACFYNLLDNAVKFSDKQEAHILLVQQKNRRVITFENKGLWLSKSEIDQMFQPFYRTQGARDQFRGHGVGLTIVLNILKLHNRKIEIYSDKGLTRISILLDP